MNIVYSCLDELLRQFTLWNEYFVRNKYCPSIIRISYGAVISMVQCKNAKRQRTINNSDEIFEWYYVGKYLQDVQFDKLIFIIQKYIPRQEKEVKRVIYIFNRLYPIVEILEKSIICQNQENLLF